MEGEVETPQTGGWVTTGVIRVGETVRRPPGPNAEFVHRVLDHLAQRGFEAAPRFLGDDERGREVLTFIEGHVPSDCRSIVWEDDQLRAVAVLLRRFHDATAGTPLAPGGEVVCHNDFGPWDLVWREARPIGVIDWDNAAPGARLDDLGYAVWHLNLGLVDVSASEQGRRLRVMAAAYDTPTDHALLSSIERAQERMRRLLATAPLGAGRDRGLEQHNREREWCRRNASSLA